MKKKFQKVVFNDSSTIFDINFYHKVDYKVTTDRNAIVQGGREEEHKG